MNPPGVLPIELAYYIIHAGVRILLLKAEMHTGMFFPLSDIVTD